MMGEISYSQRERFWLWCLALFGFVAVNGAFFYGMLFQPEALANALANPIALAFMLEAFVLLGVFAYLLTKWGVSRLHWGWFVFLWFLGSMAFALPVVLLWQRRR
jgi:uncharacterized membrane protein YhaH (DUF805 family)